jgi:hypothetical protein
MYCNEFKTLKFLITSLFVSLILPLSTFPQADWAHLGTDGRLVYKTDADGNHIMDFSTAGYMGGGVALPTVAAKVTLSPSGGDDKTPIQNAIDQVSAMPLVNGFRGAVVLSAGTFKANGSLTVAASGVAVRGAGSGAGGTLINCSGSSLFRIMGGGSFSTGNSVNIADAFVPSGAMSLNVSSASGFAVGNTILITKTVTKAWLHYIGMDSLMNGGVADTWLAVGTDITTDRTIAGISGNKITFDGPITDNFDSEYQGSPVGTVAKYTFSGRLTQCGLEDLKIVAPADTSSFPSITMDSVMDCWVRNIVIQDGVNCVSVRKCSRRITFDNVIINHTVPTTNPALPMDFTCRGTQLLFNRCRTNGVGSWCWTTGSIGTGPMVVLNFKSTQTTGIEPHQRWSTGILADCDSIPNSDQTHQGISFRNRGTYGSGHGWTTGWSVAWNAIAPYFLVSNAPGTINWAIGGFGTKTTISGDSDGIYDHFNSTVAPKSLYLQQLLERLGPQALVNIGYGGMVGTSRPSTSLRTNTAPHIHMAGATLFVTLGQADDADVHMFSTNGKNACAMRVHGKAGENRLELAAAAKNRVVPGMYIVAVSIKGEKQTLPFFVHW